MIEEFLVTCRDAVCDSEFDLYDAAEALQTAWPGADIELRIAAAEGAMDALSGRPYCDDYGDSQEGTAQALAYCGGFCLAAPGFGHARAVREILSAEQAAAMLEDGA